MKKILTAQEKFWSGNFGNKYIDRNKKANLRKNFWELILNKIKVRTVFELGTNAGFNLDAIKLVNKKIDTYGIEINNKARSVANKKGHNIYKGSLNQKIKLKKKFDLSFTSSVLIHINPKKLKFAYANINNLSSKYILINEYHSPYPVVVKYRGHNNMLFKRDFALEISKRYKYKLIDYGFLWKNDKSNFYEDMNWFLFKKK